MADQYPSTGQAVEHLYRRIADGAPREELMEIVYDHWGDRHGLRPPGPNSALPSFVAPAGAKRAGRNRMFVTEKAALAGALAAMRGATKPKETIPILSNVLFSRKDDGLMVTGSNLDLEISTSFQAEVGEDFEPFTCPAALIGEFVKNAPDGFNVAISGIRRSGHLASVEIVIGKSRARLPVLPAGDFPSMNSGVYQRELSLSASTFAAAIGGVVFAVETNEQRYALCGVLIEPDERGVAVVASNGNRMALRIIREIEFDEPPGKFPPVIVPTEAAQAIVRVLDKKEDVVVSLSEEKIRVEAGGTILLSKLVDGEFLAYRKAVVSDRAVSATVNTKALMNAAIRVMAVNGDAKSAISLELAEGAVRLVSRDEAIDGSAEDEVPAVTTGAARNGFNGKFLAAALSHIAADNVEIRVSDDRGPMQIKAATDDQDLAIMKIGPVTLRWHISPES